MAFFALTPAPPLIVPKVVAKPPLPAHLPKAPPPVDGGGKIGDIFARDLVNNPRFMKFYLRRNPPLKHYK